MPRPVANGNIAVRLMALIRGRASRCWSSTSALRAPFADCRMESGANHEQLLLGVENAIGKAGGTKKHLMTAATPHSQGFLKYLCKALGLINHDLVPAIERDGSPGAVALQLLQKGIKSVRTPLRCADVEFVCNALAPAVEPDFLVETGIGMRLAVLIDPRAPFLDDPKIIRRNRRNRSPPFFAATTSHSIFSFDGQ